MIPARARGSGATGRDGPMDADGAHQVLVLVDIVSAHGIAILQTIWAPRDNLAYGRRVTRTETIADQAQLLERLARLARPPHEHAHVARLQDPAPGGGTRRRAAVDAVHVRPRPGLRAGLVVRRLRSPPLPRPGPRRRRRTRS